MGKQYFPEKGSDLFAITLEMHRQNFWTVWKTITDLFTISCIKKRFEQNDYTTYYSKLESLLLCSAKGESCEELLSFVCNFYKDDFDKHKLETQLCSLPGIFEDKEVTDIHMVVKKFQKMSAGMRAHFSEVAILIKLLLIAPATNAVNERSCSTLLRIKTYLWTTMTQN